MSATFTRGPGRGRVEPFDIKDAIASALAHDGEADFLNDGEGGPPTLAFTLRRTGIAVHVIDIDGSHLATYADPVAAVTHGYLFTDRAACVPPPPRAQRRRSAMRGRTTR